MGKRSLTINTMKGFVKIAAKKEDKTMSMEIYRNYAAYDANAVSSAKKERKTAQQTQDSVQNYYEKLCKKFSGISINTSAKLQTGSGNKIVLNLSKDCLNRMANDAPYAKKIEEDIAGIPSAHKQMLAKAKQDGMEIHGFAVRINADGSMQCSCSGSTRTSNTGRGKGALKTDKKQNTAVEKRYRQQAELVQKATERRAERKVAIAEFAQENALEARFELKA